MFIIFWETFWKMKYLLKHTYVVIFKSENRKKNIQIWNNFDMRYQNYHLNRKIEKKNQIWNHFDNDIHTAFASI